MSENVLIFLRLEVGTDLLNSLPQEKVEKFALSKVKNFTQRALWQWSSKPAEWEDIFEYLFLTGPTYSEDCLQISKTNPNQERDGQQKTQAST